MILPHHRELILADLSAIEAGLFVGTQLTLDEAVNKPFAAREKKIKLNQALKLLEKTAGLTVYPVSAGAQYTYPGEVMFTDREVREIFVGIWDRLNKIPSEMEGISTYLAWENNEDIVSPEGRVDHPDRVGMAWTPRMVDYALTSMVCGPKTPITINPDSSFVDRTRKYVSEAIFGRAPELTYPQIEGQFDPTVIGAGGNPALIRDGYDKLHFFPPSIVTQDLSYVCERWPTRYWPRKIGGTVTSTSSTLTIGNNYEVYPGVFTHNSGTVIFNATDSGNTIAGRPESTRGFYNLTFDGVSGAWTLLPESGYLVTVANNFTITNGTVTSVASPGWLTVSGNYSNSGTFTHNSGTVRFDATDSGNTLAGTLSSTSKFYNLTFSGSGGAWSFTSNPAVEVANNFTISNGTVTSTSSTLTVTGNYSNSGTFTHNNGTVLMNATDSGNTLAGTLSGTSKFYNLTFNGSGGAWSFTSNPAVEVANNFTITQGTVTSTSSTLTVTGNYSNSGTFTNGSGTVLMNATDAGNTLAGTLSGTSKFYNLTFNGVSGDWSFTSNPAVEVANDLTITNGTLTSTSHASGLTVSGNFSNSGTFTNNSGTVIFNATDSGNTLAGTLSGSSKFYNLTFDGVSGAWSFTSNPSVEVNNNLTITNGTVTSTSGNLTVTGNYSNAGTFTHNSGTVIMNAIDTGNTLAGTLSGSSKFYNLTFNGSGGAWSFTSNPAVEVNNDLTITNGTVTSTSGNLTITGNYSNSGSFKNNLGTVIMNATDSGNTLAGTLSGTTGKFYNLTFNGSGGAWSFTSNPTVEINNDMTITLGTVTSTSGNLVIGGNYSNSGTFTHNSGTTIFNGVHTSNTLAGTLSGSSSFYNLKFDKCPSVNSPVGYWNFEEGTGGTTADNCANGFTGTLGTGGNTPTWTTGKYGNGLSFDGNDYVNVGSQSGLHFNYTDSFSISGWVNVPSVPTSGQYQFIAIQTGSDSNYGAFQYSIMLDGDTTGKLCAVVGRAGVGNNEVCKTSVISINTWYHIVGVYDGTYISTYIDGAYVNRVAYSQGGATAPSGDFVIGGSNNNYYLNGKADNITVYNYALTPEQVVEDMNRAGGEWSYTSNPNVDVANNFTITNGIHTSTSGNLKISNNYSNSGTFTHNSGTVTMNATDAGNTLAGTMSGSPGKFYNLTFNGSGGAWSFTSNPAVEVANDFTITLGTVTSTSSTLTITGNYSNSGTFTNGSGTVLMNATDSGNTLAGTLSGTSAFYNLTFNGSGGAWSFTSNPAVEVANDFTITTGTVTSTSNASGLIITGNYSNSGTFTNNSGLVKLRQETLLGKNKHLLSRRLPLQNH
jgi:small nuclear ribonucleoprotein (snRNP)-like protein